MWTRSDLKSMAKANLRTKYWTAFVVSLIVGILGGNASPTFSYRSSSNSAFDPSSLDFFTSERLAIIIPLILLFAILAILFSILVSYPVVVGGNRWFSRSRESAATPSVGLMFSLFKSGSYLKTVGSMLWMNLFLFLWQLLAVVPMIFAVVWLLQDPSFLQALISLFRSGSPSDVLDFFESIDWTAILYFGLLELAAVVLSIPGIIKSYSYRLTPWILADSPQIGFRRALRLSIDLTRGHKWAIFVLDLSFIGWFLLGVLACGVGILFVVPYFMATMAELYAVLRQNGVGSGLCTMEELGFIPVSPSASTF
jgi:uncharacterized membrane protein